MRRNVGRRAVEEKAEGAQRARQGGDEGDLHGFAEGADVDTGTEHQ